VDPYLIMLLVASLYILAFGLLGFLRREGLSAQFALEGAALTVVLVGGSWLLHLPLNPFVFLAVLYLVTMRSRLAVDAANFMMRRKYQKIAFRLYDLALAWWPDAPSRLIVLVNKGAAQLHTGQVEASIETLKSVLAEQERRFLGPKYEAACHYNLGRAYEKAGEEAKAIAQYAETIELLPGSTYAKAAQAGLKRRQQQDSRDRGT
jgi:tetratricopeptide (TPR) repeat protein